MRSPSCESMKEDVKKGSWSQEEDDKLKSYIARYGIWNWSHMPKFAGLNRSGKSCRLRWMNYLKPDIKRGKFSKEEEDIILHYHSLLGNRWSKIASKVPGRSDNEIKNYWHTNLKKRVSNYMSQTTEDNDISESAICETNVDEIIILDDDYSDNSFGSLLLQTGEEDSSCSSSTSTSNSNSSKDELENEYRFNCCYDLTSMDHGVGQFNREEYYYNDLSSPGTVKDLQSYWNQLWGSQNMQVGCSHQDITFEPAFQCSYNEENSLDSFYSNEFDIISM